MNKKPQRLLFTSESVTEGHPDKLCDRISDAVLDAILTEDKNARVACESFVTTGLVVVMGEITTSCYVDIPKIIRETVCSVGYDRPEAGFDGNTCAVMTSIKEQSPDIAMGVDRSLETKSGQEEALSQIGAGDQGLMFGFACDETPALMPLPASLAHALARRLAEVRKTGLLPYLCPDGKTQVTVEYDGFTPLRVDTVVVSSQHTENVTLEQIRADLTKHVIEAVIDPKWLVDTKIYINPTGRFVIGGPQGDTGLTGRKIIVDTYGGAARHGGGAFSGKDPTKVDRSASYAARYVARNVVAAGLASRCEVQIAYAIGVARPVSVRVDTFGTGAVPDALLTKAAEQVFDLRPAAIIRDLNLTRPIYTPTSAYGHMGRTDLDLPWEKSDKVQALLDAVEELKK